jgi:hypothetical protein
LANGDIVTGGTRAGSDKEQLASGIVLGHAYAVIGTHRVKSNGQRLMIVRDPHGRDYPGDNPYNASSKIWTRALLEELPGGDDDSDGVVYLPLDRFMADFSHTYANINT